LLLSGVVLLLAIYRVARADDRACVSTAFNLLSPNDKVCVSDFEDPKVPGVTCFIPQARKGGWGQPLGLNEDPSNFSVACRQLGPITTDISTLPKSEEAFTEKTSIFFKKTRIYRMPDWSAARLYILRSVPSSSTAHLQMRSALCRSCPGRQNDRTGSGAHLPVNIAHA
jgi:CreA protein